MKKECYAMIYLVACGVNRIKPDMKYISDIDMEVLFRLSTYHLVEVLAGTSLKEAGTALPEQWTQKLSKSMRKNILFDNERKKIFDFMEQSGIWYLPLKGTVLKDYYPSVGMRQMSDNDILFDGTFSDRVRTYMESQGYVSESHGKGAHDVYMKNPVYNFELHRTLFEESGQPIMSRYYADVKERLILNDGSSYGYHFSDEDFYIYTVAHAYKHYSGSGTGIRSLLDFYVYLSAKEQSMDFEYIDRECEKIGLFEFEKQSRALCKKVFGKQALTSYEQFTDSLSAKEQEMLGYYLSSGVYGTTERGIKNRISGFREKSGSTSKFRYLVNRLFPDMEMYKSYYPFFYRHKLLLPIGWLYRLLRMIFSKKRRNSAVKEIGMVRKYE